MIRIVQGKSKKVPGGESLTLSFPYDEAIVGIVKQVEPRNYDPKTKEWEVPLTCLATLIDDLVHFDDVEFVATKEEAREERKPVLTYRTKPFGYQLEDIAYGLNHDRFFLLHDPGLGKTLIATYIAEELHAQEGIEHCLIICGLASLRTNWAKEIARHSSLDCMMVGARYTRNGRLTWDSVSKRVEQLMNPIREFFVIINVESLRDDRIIEALNKGPNGMGLMVFDEVHKASGTSSQQGENLRLLSCRHQIAMTGSLIVNNPVNCYNALVWLGLEPKRSLTKFKNAYCVFDDRTRGRIIGFKNLDLLQNEILSNGIRRRKSEVLELPEKTIIDESLTMSDRQAKFYFDIDESIRKNSDTKELAIEECDRVRIDTSSILAIVTRLRQATTCPRYLTSMDVDSCKMERAKALIEEIVNSGEKVVVFSSFKEPLAELMESVGWAKPLLCTGDQTEQEFSDNIDAFQNDDEHMVLLGTLSKCGTGITLTRASYMIMMDQPWTYALYLQATDRIYRVGTNRPVTVYNLICEGTIDSKISEIIGRKKALGDYLIDERDDYDTLETLRGFVFGL